MSLVKFNVTRNSPKWTLNSSGNLQSGSDNLPGFEFNPDLTYKGMLVEPASTNLLKNSEAAGAIDGIVGSNGRLPYINNVIQWVAQNEDGTVTTEVIDSGVENGYNYVEVKFVATGDNNNYRLNFNHPTESTVNVGDNLVLSTFLKLITGDAAEIKFLFAERNSGQSQLKSYVSSGIQQGIDNTIKRFSHEYTTDKSDVFYVSVGLNIRFNNGDNFTLRIYTPQLEKNNLTSPILTLGSTKTRLEDVITLTSASQYLPSEGKVTLGWEQKEDDTIYIGALSASIGSGSRELVYEYSSTEQTLSIDGTEVQTITGQFDFSGMDKIQLGHVNGADQPNTHLKYFAVE